jgi:AraC-like DNA-binding protein
VITPRRRDVASENRPPDPTRAYNRDHATAGSRWRRMPVPVFGPPSPLQPGTEDRRGVEAEDRHIRPMIGVKRQSAGHAMRERTTWIDPDTARQPAFVLSARRDPGTSPWHEHQRAQLVYVTQGVVKVITDDGMWVIPPRRGVWVLPAVRHQVTSARAYSLCTLYAERHLVTLPDRCAAVEIDPLVRELLRAASRFADRYERDSADDHLVRVLLERVPTRPFAALYLPEPQDDSLRRVTEHLKLHPDDPKSLADWAHEMAMSERSAARAFTKQLGMPFGKWRQRLRLIVALEQLGQDSSVKAVALNVGYRDVSAFITMFKESLGVTPGHYARRGKPQ